MIRRGALAKPKAKVQRFQLVPSDGGGLPLVARAVSLTSVSIGDGLGPRRDSPEITRVWRPCKMLAVPRYRPRATPVREASKQVQRSNPTRRPCLPVLQRTPQGPVRVRLGLTTHGRWIMARRGMSPSSRPPACPVGNRTKARQIPVTCAPGPCPVLMDHAGMEGLGASGSVGVACGRFRKASSGGLGEI